MFQLPILIGVSRKSMVYKLLGGGPEDALNGTTALHAIALMKGARILRVHDVKAATETVRIFRHLKNDDSKHELSYFLHLCLSIYTYLALKTYSTSCW